MIDQLLSEPAGYALVLQRLRVREHHLIDLQAQETPAQPVSERAPLDSPPEDPAIVVEAARFSYKTGKLTRTVTVGDGTQIVVTGLQRGIEETAGRIVNDAA